MITKFKIFEQSSHSLKRTYETDLYLFSNLNVGDYVIVKETSVKDENLNEFLSTHVGILENESKLGRKIIYKVSYDKIPNIIRRYFNGSNFRYFTLKDVRKATSEEIENYKINQNIDKYNI